MEKLKSKIKSGFYILKNVISMNKEAFRFSRYQYFCALLNCIYLSVTPFINIFFPKWIIDELSSAAVEWSRVLFLVCAWGLVNFIIITILKTNAVFEYVANFKNGVRENAHYGKMDAEMDYERLENGAVLDEKNRIRSTLYLPYYAFSPGVQTVFSIAQALGYTYIIASLSPVMVAFLLLIVFLKSVLSKTEQKLDYQYQKKISGFKRKFSYLFGAMMGYKYAKEVRINNASEWLQEKYIQEQTEYVKIVSKRQKMQFIINMLGHIIVCVQTIVLYCYSAYCTFTGAASIGDFTMYIGAITGFISSINFLTYVITNMKYFSEYIDGYKKYVDGAVSFHDKKGINDAISSGSSNEIVFENVSFKYPNTDRYVLKDISVKIKTGEKVSIVGYNGAGKSTFIKLICGLYEPTNGRILYNGCDISTLKYEQYAKLLGVVFQDFNIYSMSVRDNICLNNQYFDDAFDDAIEKSGLSGKMLGLEQGAETQVGREFDSKGIEFSGGEGQKLACARAYYKNAPIVILDEPTASLDPISESLLYERFSNIMGDKTSIYISHRLASSKFCDVVLVFRNGEIVEKGTHEELIRRGGLYADMFMKQSSYYVNK